MKVRSRRPPLRVLYEELNAKFWDGRLPPVQRELTVGGDPRSRGVQIRRVGIRSSMRGLRVSGQGYCIGRFVPAGAFWPARINILSPLRAAEERRVLLHEMIHCALFFAGIEDLEHGVPFGAELERLADLGEAWAREQWILYYDQAWVQRGAHGEQ